MGGILNLMTLIARDRFCSPAQNRTEITLTYPIFAPYRNNFIRSQQILTFSVSIFHRNVVCVKHILGADIFTGVCTKQISCFVVNRFILESSAFVLFDDIHFMAFHAKWAKLYYFFYDTHFISS